MNVLLKSGKLLDENGVLISSGFAFDLVKEYHKSEVYMQGKLKEVNRYYIFNDKFSLTITIGSGKNDAYLAVTFNDFEENIKYSKVKTKYFGDSIVVMPPASTMGSIEFAKKDFSFEVYNDYSERKILLSLKNIAPFKDFYCSIKLNETTIGSSVVAVPFEKDGEFLYNQKISCLKASGFINLGTKKYDLSNDTRGAIDWIRAVYPSGALKYNFVCISALQNEKEVGLTLVDKLGNNKYATSNMFFYNEHAYKLDEIRLRPVSKSKILESEWRIDSSDGQIELNFTPFSYNHDGLSNIYQKVNRKIVYGKFNGYVMFDKDKIEIDNLIGFIEINDNIF